MKLKDYEVGSVVAELDIENETIDVIEDTFRVVFDGYKEPVMSFPGTGERKEITFSEGENGFLKAFVTQIPDRYDLEDVSDWERLKSVDKERLVENDESSKSKKSIFQKTEWEPYVGPQGGKGWRNPESGEVVYGDEPPGDVSVPDEFPGVLETDFTLNELDPEDEVLAITSDGEAVIVDADNPYLSPSDVFGVVTEEDESVEDPGSFEDYGEIDDSAQDLLDDVEDALDEPDPQEDWDERNPEELADIPEGTEVSVETATQSITGEFGGQTSSEYVEEWVIGDEIISTDELTEPDTELYVNEDSVPESEEEPDVDPVLFQEEPEVEPSDDTPSTTGPELLEDLEEYHQMPIEDYEFNPEEVGVDGYKDDILAMVPAVSNEDFNEYGWESVGDFLRDHPEDVMAGDLFDTMMLVNEMEKQGETKFDVGDDFSYGNVQELEEGQYIQVTTNDGSTVKGKITNSSEALDLLEVESPAGNVTMVNFHEVTGGSVIEQDDIDYLDEVPDNASKDEIVGYMANEGIEISDLGMGEKEDVANILVEAKQKGTDNSTVASVMADIGTRRNRQRVCKNMLMDVTVESEKLGIEVPYATSHRVESEIAKRHKQFTEEYPEFEDEIDEIDNIINDWTGGSVKVQTAGMWAVAAEEGEDNIPDDMAQWIDDVLDENPELVDAVREYSEFTQDVMRDLFGDSVTLFRGIGGDYGRSRSNDLMDGDEQSTTVDHRGIASWSLNPDVGNNFSGAGGVITCQEMDIEDLMLSFVDGAGFGYESEIVASGGVSDYEYADTPEDVGDGSIIPAGELGSEGRLEVFLNQYDSIADN